MVDSGGSIIKTSDDGLLLQSSIQSDIIKMLFSRKNKEENPGDFENVSVGGGFVEFIERKQGREGFEAKSALHIFDSTTIP